MLWDVPQVQSRKAWILNYQRSPCVEKYTSKSMSRCHSTSHRQLIETVNQLEFEWYSIATDANRYKLTTDPDAWALFIPVPWFKQQLIMLSLSELQRSQCSSFTFLRYSWLFPELGRVAKYEQWMNSSVKFFTLFLSF